ncbi:unnamed protein product [Adineta ricciae]|uniref:Uncharacterized protein n=1 Tax=Adineta ricciae TaxID=249248 RepID=A0A815AQ92_ADIRI|nr:unnamed protein product [Adineta ricciae]CAF1303556.1 unnamed protein product [Adineta ricciae]
MAIRTDLQTNSMNIYSHPENYSPPSSNESDSSSSSTSSTTNSTSLMNSIHSQLCICPNRDCVIHDIQRLTTIPSELSTTSNPTYGNKNLLLYYAHLERCRRHGLNFHQNIPL